MASYPRVESLFGDMSLDAAVADSVASRCHSLLQEARSSLRTGDSQRARSLAESVASMPEIDSRYQAQGWHLYRLLGGRPSPDVAKLVLGVIVEVGIEKGNDILAVYADGNAYYYNHAGSVVAWTRPDASLDGLINTVLREARVIVDKIGPWEGNRRPAPPDDQMRLNILTPSGIHFGEGPFSQLQRDRLARRLVLAASKLVASLTTLAFGS